MIQIGMNCDPEWLCDSISAVIALLLALMVIGLIRVIVRERKQRKKTYVIKPRNRRTHREDQ